MTFFWNFAMEKGFLCFFRVVWHVGHEYGHAVLWTDTQSTSIIHIQRWKSKLILGYDPFQVKNNDIYIRTIVALANLKAKVAGTLIEADGWFLWSCDPLSAINIAGEANFYYIDRSFVRSSCIWNLCTFCVHFPFVLCITHVHMTLLARPKYSFYVPNSNETVTSCCVSNWNKRMYCQFWSNWIWTTRF